MKTHMKYIKNNSNFLNYLNIKNALIFQIFKEIASIIVNSYYFFFFLLLHVRIPLVFPVF